MSNNLYALVSVTDKTGLVELGQRLAGLNRVILSTGGTAGDLRAGNVAVTDVADVTGFPEMMGGRLKTLHPMIHGGILHDRAESEHVAAALEYHMPTIDLVFVNLYNFAGKPGIENIDIGGPTMIRAAAKNHASVGVVVDPADYDWVLTELEQTGSLSDDTRRQLARKAFAHTAAYDAAITTWFDEQLGDPLPPTIHLTLTRSPIELAYGENAWQVPAGLYLLPTDDPLGAGQLQPLVGVPSYNNLVDWERAQQALTQIIAAFELNFDQSSLVAIGVKHGNPCCAAQGSDKATVIKRALEGDLQAIHGGVMIFNFEIDVDEAELLAHYAQPPKENDPEEVKQRLLDAVIAPAFTDGAIQILRRKADRCRFLVNPALAELTGASLDTARRYRYIRGGMVVQPNYTNVFDLTDEYVTGVWPADRPPTERVLQAAVLAKAICGASNSNTITLASPDMLVGNGVGQQDRVGAAKLAMTRASHSAMLVQRQLGQLSYDWSEVAAGSDSFLPFVDGAEVLTGAGINTLLSTCGSITGDEPVMMLFDSAGKTLIWLPDAVGRSFSDH